jgi:hypothetical protein
VGRSLTLNGALFTIVGVADGFSGVWLESPVEVLDIRSDASGGALFAKLQRGRFRN